MFLAMFAVITFYFVVASLRTDMVLLAVFALIFIGLVLLSVEAGTATPDITKAGGWVTLAFAVLAWYHAAGDVIGYTFGRTVLPVDPCAGHIPRRDAALPKVGTVDGTRRPQGRPADAEGASAASPSTALIPG